MGTHRTLAISLEPHPRKTPSYYDQGVLTKSEALLCLISLVTPANVASTVQMLSDDWLADVRSDIGTAPTDDWSTFRIVQAGAFVMSAEQYDEMLNKQVADYRTGVESLRAFLDDNGFL